MAFIPAANCVRTSVIFSLAGQELINTFWFKREAPWTQAQREALNDAIATFWESNWKGVCPPTMTLVMITTVNQDAANSPASSKVINPPSAGTAPYTAGANNVAMCATLRTDLRGRSYRGRTYLGGIVQQFLASPIAFSSGAISGFITVLASLKTAVEAVGAIWVVVSHFANKTARTSAVTTPVTAISIDQYVDSQRRRLGLRGV